MILFMWRIMLGLSEEGKHKRQAAPLDRRFRRGRGAPAADV